MILLVLLRIVIINNEDDYHTIQSIIHSFNGSIYYDEKIENFTLSKHI